MRGRGGGDESGAAGRGAGGGCAGGGAGRSEVAVCCTLAGAVVVRAIASLIMAAIPAPLGEASSLFARPPPDPLLSTDPPAWSCVLRRGV